MPERLEVTQDGRGIRVVDGTSAVVLTTQRLQEIAQDSAMFREYQGRAQKAVERMGLGPLLRGSQPLEVAIRVVEGVKMKAGWTMDVFDLAAVALGALIGGGLVGLLL